MEKMSKSKGNVVTIDEVVYGVSSVASGYEFRDENSELIDPVNRAYRMGNSYRLHRKYGHHPVFLHYKDDPVPPLIMGKVQHENLLDYWSRLLAIYEHMTPEQATQHFKEHNE